jgi:hydroxyacylglutathione hydrolase
VEIEEGIHQLAFGRANASGIGCPNAFLVCGRTGAVFLDTGWPEEEDHQRRMAYLSKTGISSPNYIVMLHRHHDHAGGALRLHQDTGARLACHELDRPAIEEELLQGRARVQDLISEGDRLDLGGMTIEFFHAPGHTLGSMAAYIPERRVLFTTDTVLSTSSTAVGDRGDMSLYMQTLHRLQFLDLGRIFPGHGPVVEDAPQRLRDLIEHRKQREKELLEAIDGGARTVEELVKRLYGDLPLARRRTSAQAQIRSMLRKLQGEGRVATTGNGLLTRRS